MSRKSENVKAWRKRTKERMVQAFGNVCCICNKTYVSELYDFHHINPKEKKFSMAAARGSSTSWQKIVKELRKCIMACANCHRLIEYKYKSIPLKANRFNENYATYAPIRLIFPKYADHNCPICKNNKVLRKHTYCSIKCSAVVLFILDPSYF